MSDKRPKPVSQLSPFERMDEWEMLADKAALEGPLTPEEEKRKAQLAASLPELAAEEACYDVLDSALQGPTRLASADDPLIRAALQAVELDRLPAVGETERSSVQPRAGQPKPRLFGGRWSRGSWLALPVLAFTLGGVFLGYELWNRTDPTAIATTGGAAQSTQSTQSTQMAPDLPRLLLATGEVRIDAAPVASGARLGVGARVQTSTGQACFGMDRNVVVCLGAETEVAISTLGDRQRVELARGRAVARLNKQPVGTDFGITTRSGTAIAVGTAFAVEVTRAGLDDSAELRVLEGTVRAETNSGKTLVHQQQQLDFATQQLGALDTDASERDRTLLAATQLWTRGAENRLVLSTDPPNATVLIDDVALGQTPLSVDVQPGRHAIEVRAQGFGNVERRLTFAGAPINEHIVLIPVADAPSVAPSANGTTGSTTERSMLDSRDAKNGNDSSGSSAAGQPDAALGPAALLDQARTARQSGRYSEAAASYRQLTQRHPGSAEAGAALLSLADLELTQLGDPATALGLYAKYLQRGGSLAQEAQYGHLRALRALGRETEEQREIAAFLRKYPDSAYAATLKRRLSSP